MERNCDDVLAAVTEGEPKLRPKAEKQQLGRQGKGGYAPRNPLVLERTSFRCDIPHEGRFAGWSSASSSWQAERRGKCGYWSPDGTHHVGRAVVEVALQPTTPSPLRLPKVTPCMSGRSFGIAPRATKDILIEGAHRLSTAAQRLLARVQLPSARNLVSAHGHVEKEANGT